MYLFFHDLVLVTPYPPSPLVKVAGSTKSCSKLGGTTLNGGGDLHESYVSQPCDLQLFEVKTLLFLGNVSK